MSEIKILQVKLIKQGEGLELAFRNNQGVVSNDGKDCKEAVHPDMVKAVNALAVHLAILTDYLPEKKSHDAEALDCFTVTGYAWNSKENGVTITGYKTTTRGRAVILNVFTNTESDDDSGYALTGDMLSKISAIETEVHAYLKGEKKLQAAMEFPEADDTVTNMKIDRPEIDETGFSDEGKEWSLPEYQEKVKETETKSAKVVALGDDNLETKKRGRKKAK